MQGWVRASTIDLALEGYTKIYPKHISNFQWDDSGIVPYRRENCVTTSDNTLDAPNNNAPDFLREPVRILSTIVFEHGVHALQIAQHPISFRVRARL
jgi:hypothetical protein